MKALRAVILTCVVLLAGLGIGGLATLVLVLRLGQITMKAGACA